MDEYNCSLGLTRVPPSHKRRKSKGSAAKPQAFKYSSENGGCDSKSRKYEIERHGSDRDEWLSTQRENVGCIFDLSRGRQDAIEPSKQTNSNKRRDELSFRSSSTSSENSGHYKSRKARKSNAINKPKNSSIAQETNVDIDTSDYDEWLDTSPKKPKAIHTSKKKRTTVEGYKSTSSSDGSDESTADDLEILEVKQSNKKPSHEKKKSNSNYKAAKSKSTPKISEQITSPSQLKWYKIRKNRTILLRPCRVLSLGEATRVKTKCKQNGDVVVQFLTSSNTGGYECVDDLDLYPFTNKSGKMDEKNLNQYVQQQSLKYGSDEAESEKQYLMHVFRHASHVESDEKTRAQKDFDDGSHNSDSDSEAHFKDAGASDDEVLLTPKPIFEEEECKLKDDSDDEKLLTPKPMHEEDPELDNDNASDDEVVEVPNPIFEPEEEETTDEFLDCPYTQAYNFDPDLNNLDQDISNEPMRPGDVIEYYSPIFVSGDKRGLRQATVLSISPNADTILNLSNGDVLPEDHRVKRIKVVDGKELVDHPGIYRPIDNFKLVEGQVKGNNGVSGVMMEAARFGDIFRKNLSKMQAAAEADGFAPMDMMRLPRGSRAGADQGARKPSSPQKSPTPSRRSMSKLTYSPSSFSESSGEETPKKATVASKPSPKSLKRAMNCTDHNNRRTQALQHSSSSSSSDENDNETLTEMTKKKYSLQPSATPKPSAKNASNSSSSGGKENINNICKAKKSSIDHASCLSSPAMPKASSPLSLGPSLASTPASLGASLASSSSSDESVSASPSKYQKTNSKNSSPRKSTCNTTGTIDLSADVPSEDSSDSYSKKIANKKKTLATSKRDPLSFDDISESDDEIMTPRNKSIAKRTTYSSDWVKEKGSWVKSGGSGFGLSLTRRK